MREKARAAAGTRLAFLLGLSVFAPGTRGEDRAPTELHLSGSVVVCVLPSPPAPRAASVEAFRQAVEKARPRLEGNGVKVLESGPVLLVHGSLLQRRRRIDFRKTQNFVGTVFFRDGHEPQVQRGMETEGELLSRAEKYFGLTSP